MIIQTSRFGERVVEEGSIIAFDSGLLGFQEMSRFVLFDIAENSSFKWLQSMEAPELAFLLVDPFTVNKDYCVDLSDELVKELSISNPADVIIYTTVSIPKSGFKNSTTNLIGPIVINWRARKAKQIIYEQGNNSTQYPLFNNGNNVKKFGG